MLDIKLIREDPERIRKAMDLKGDATDLSRFLILEEERRLLLKEVESLKQQRNQVSKNIAQLKLQERDSEEQKKEMRLVSNRIKELDEKLKRTETELEAILLHIPNIPDPDVPEGKTDAHNLAVRHWGEIPSFSFDPKPHWDLGDDLGILDFPRAGKITGSRFALYYGKGAQLERALINFMLDLHTAQHGYLEVFPPFMVNRASMTGTGQLPKFEEDMFKLDDGGYYLIPTAEVPLTNIHRGEILEEGQLPLYYVAYSACFRAEAGTHGRDTRGLIRQHQFNKVELVKFVHPQNSNQELESLVKDAEKVLQLLKIPYRVVLMCTGDLGFAAAKKYDLEVWLPSFNTYREVSSCSNFRDFQARRAGIRFRPGEGKKTEYVHTLNGSGLAVGRTVAALLENFQQEDGTVVIPETLRRYFTEGDEIIKPRV